MRRITYIFLALFICVSSVSEAKSSLLMGVTGKQLPADPTDEIVQSATEIFDNGNSFVRMQTSTLGRDVMQWLPSVMTPDEVMEVLIKIRTAITGGANRVRVSAPAPLNRVRVIGASGAPIALDLPQLLQSAGADVFVEPVLKKKNKRTKQPETFVVANEYLSLRDQVANHLNATPLQSPWASNQNLAGSTVYVVGSSAKPVNENLLKDLALIQRMTQQGANVIFLSPYLPYARSDKMDQPGITVTGRLIADMIEVSGTKMMVFFRAHAPQSQGFFSIPTFQIYARESIIKVLQAEGTEVIVAPDAGAYKDNSIYAKTMNIPIGQINKVRNPLTSEISATQIVGADVRGKVVAVLDDETASGSTLESAASVLKAAGASRVVAVVVHLAGVAKKALESPNIDKLIVTDTIPLAAQRSSKLQVISVVDEMGPLLKNIEESDWNKGCRLELL